MRNGCPRRGCRASWAILLILSQLSGEAAWAYDLGNGAEKVQGPNLTSEYIYRKDSDEALIPIYLLGAVARPGLYHIPSNMDVVALLTLAGGTLPDARVDEITIKGQGASQPHRPIQFDLKAAVQDADAKRVGLTSNDIVYVTPAKPPVSGAILTSVGIVAGILGIVASGILIHQNIK